MGQTALTAPLAPPMIRKRPTTPPASSAAATLATGQSLALAGIAHDARNLVTALNLCADLIAEPGVLAKEDAHLAGDVRSIADASGYLMRRLSALSRTATLASQSLPESAPIADLAQAVRALSGLLAAVAGPSIGVQIACLPCAGQLRLTEENLTRILLNLVRNAADAMPEGGRIRITAQRGGGASFLWTLPRGADDECADQWEEAVVGGGPQTAVLTIEDEGPGIAPELLEKIFEPGFSTRRAERPWPEALHHGLGLSIARQLAEEAGGTIRALTPPRRGARFEVELPLTKVTPNLPSEPPSGHTQGAW
ncbi:MAG TPA: ATP-binding protein [Acidobacteriaceae bacterium]|jgi:signal transduction histidine kinase|nr:ATP-binding protein [Acidobacteriaceae bacterium]